MSTTLNITATTDTAKNQDFTHATAGVNDQVACIIYESGAAIITKRSAAMFGSSDEIAITAGSKYTVKLTSGDTRRIASGCTYKLIKYAGDEEGLTPTVLYEGTIPVSGNAAVLPIHYGELMQAKDYVFTEDTEFELSDKPAIILWVYVQSTLTNSAVEIKPLNGGAVYKQNSLHYGQKEIQLINSFHENNGVMTQTPVTYGGTPMSVTADVWDGELKVRIYYMNFPEL